MCLLVSILLLAASVEPTTWDGITPWFSDSSCECNGFSRRCFFDAALERATGRAAHCLDCQGDREGPACERCRHGFWAPGARAACRPCRCHPLGSKSQQCNSQGQCICKPGVTGNKCDKCKDNYYDLSNGGCKPCICNEAGSVANKSTCDPVTGLCNCKENVEGDKCHRCKYGYFNLDEKNIFGCTPCFCHGHSMDCESARGYSKSVIKSTFEYDAEGWKAEDHDGFPVKIKYDADFQAIGINASQGEPVTFIAPDRFLGDQRASYNQLFSFKLWLLEDGKDMTFGEIIIEGAGKILKQVIYGNSIPTSAAPKQYQTFRLHEHRVYEWLPHLSSQEFIHILSNISSWQIKGTSSTKGTIFLDDVELGTAVHGMGDITAKWVEKCVCPNAYTGQFCESCALGYYWETHNEHATVCVPCSCNGHAEMCDENTGQCNCQHNTAGHNCELCAKGFYGNALQGSVFDCMPCPCPNGGPCLYNGSNIVCLECPAGYTGPRCNICEDGYYGDPDGINGPVMSCQPCECNGNIDFNDTGNCNATTGVCLKCIFNTEGEQCERCSQGFYGNAIASIKGNCTPCHCNKLGTLQSLTDDTICDHLTGQCPCKPHVTGRDCDTCEDGYFNIKSSKVCEVCKCDPTGSVSQICDKDSGQCTCREGVTGKQCDACEIHTHKFSENGCKKCECNPLGSSSPLCDNSGQCSCLEDVEGLKCDRCKENMYDLKNGCLECPQCYSLVESNVGSLRQSLQNLMENLNEYEKNSHLDMSDQFETQLLVTNISLDIFQKYAMGTLKGGEVGLKQKINELQQDLDATDFLKSVTESGTENIINTIQQCVSNISHAEEIIQAVLKILENNTDYLDVIGSISLNAAQTLSAALNHQNYRIFHITKEAKAMVARQHEDLQFIMDTASACVKVASEVNRMPTEAINNQYALSNENEKLKAETEVAVSKMELTKAVTDDSVDKVNDAYSTALNNHIEISSLNFPEVDLVKIQLDATTTVAQASAIISVAMEMWDENRELYNSTAENISKSNNLLKLVAGKQTLVNSIYDEIQEINANVDSTVELASSTYKEVADAHKNIQVFDKNVQHHKKLAHSAVLKIPKIKHAILNSQKMTTNIKNHIEESELQTNYALKMAHDIQHTHSTKISEGIAKINRESGAAKVEAIRLFDEAYAFSSRVRATKADLTAIEYAGNSNRNKIVQVKGDIDQMRYDQVETLKVAQWSLQQIRSITEEMTKFSELDISTIEILERKFVMAENELLNIRLDERIRALREARHEQMQWIHYYEDEIIKLRAEVAHTEQVANALPKACGSRLQLEP
ncbi:laminin subunit gamma-1-like isoform X2 [Schistocerca nitens]|uniref:laminin subunit gamma-1-like isoform X2 n=1 Tax=Schistocerca nitens TaxID=7011 RepID=UPI002118306C|nr:laminin subunit gamma-1-like isoform X2 [Schistocerca nitens]